MAQHTGPEQPEATGGQPGMSSIVDDAGAIAGDLKAAALDGSREFIQAARVQATGFADRRKEEAAQSVSDIASSLRDTGRGFEGRPNIQAFVSGAAEGLDQLAAGLRDRSFAELYGDAEAIARRSPLAVGAVAVAAGFLLARFIKSSADDLSEASASARRARTRPGSVSPIDA